MSWVQPKLKAAAYVSVQPKLHNTAAAEDYSHNWSSTAVADCGSSYPSYHLSIYRYIYSSIASIIN